MKLSPFLILTFSILLLGCDYSSTNSQTEKTVVEATPVNNNQPQSLPISAKLIVNNEIIELEVAQTPQQQATGLMYRDFIPPNRGMLFPFNPPQTVSFWMKNVPISLDMIFVSQGVVKHIVTASPCTIEPCSLYNSNVPIDQVIELAENRTKELGLKVGDKISIEFLSPKKK